MGCGPTADEGLEADTKAVSFDREVFGSQSSEERTESGRAVGG